VLADYVTREEIHLGEAVKIAKRVLFENTNQLYRLGIKYADLDLNGVTTTPSMTASVTTISAVPALKNTLNQNDLSQAAGQSSSATLDNLVASLKSQNIKFIRLAWVDYVNLIRYRAIPIDHFTSIVGSQLIQTPSSLSFEQLAESGISIVQAALGLTVNDGLTPGVSASGDHDYKPDFSSLWKPSFAPGHAYMMGRLFHKSHEGGAESETCPRTILQRVVQ
jgi:hypothetical protein